MSDEWEVGSMSDVGKLIRQTRQAASMSQQELANRVGTTRQWVIRLEQGHPSSSISKTLIALSELGLELVAIHDLPPQAPRNALERRMTKMLGRPTPPLHIRSTESLRQRTRGAHRSASNRQQGML